jgi:hypothetical protein
MEERYAGTDALGNTENRVEGRSTACEHRHVQALRGCVMWGRFAESLSSCFWRRALAGAFAFGLVGLGLVLGPAVSRARAQEEPPDVVRLLGGRIVRGTVIERRAGERVVIDVEGQFHTYPWSEVLYAGPYPEPERTPEPETPPPPPPPEEEPIEVVRGPHRMWIFGDRGISLYVEVGVELALARDRGTAVPVARYELLCTAPCNAELTHGSHRVALSDGSGAPAEVGPTLRVERELRLSVHFVDRSEVRLAGMLLALAGIVPGLVLISAGLLALRDGPADAGLIGVGAGFFGLSAIGIPVASWGDTRTVEVEPVEIEE